VRMFMVRDLIVRYRGSVLGVLWSLATPLVQMVVMTIVFRYFFPLNEPNYSFKLLSGLLAWSYFRDTTLNSCSCIIEARDVIKKIYFPRAVVPISVVFGNGVHFLIAMVMMLVIFAARPVALTPSYLFLPVLVLVQTVLLLGVAMLVACAHTFYRDVKYIVDAGLQVAFYLTPIIYPVEFAHDGLVRAVSRFLPPGYDYLAPWLFRLYMLNPMATLGTAYRQVLLRNELPDMQFFLPIVALSLIVFVLGYRTFVKHSWKFPEIL